MCSAVFTFPFFPAAILFFVLSDNFLPRQRLFPSAAVDSFFLVSSVTILPRIPGTPFLATDILRFASSLWSFPILGCPSIANWVCALTLSNALVSSDTFRPIFLRCPLFFAEIAAFAASVHLIPSEFPAVRQILKAGSSLSMNRCSYMIRSSFAQTARSSNLKLSSPCLLHALWKCLLWCVPCLACCLCSCHRTFTHWALPM